MELDLTLLDESQLATLAEAYETIISTERGSEILGEIVMSEKIYTIKMNDEGDTGYDPETNTINWDPKFAAMAGDDKPLTPTLLLAHEFGHAYTHDTHVGSSDLDLTLEAISCAAFTKCCRKPERSFAFEGSRG